MPRPIRTRTDEEWATMIRTQREIGLSVAKFCRQNNINQQAFYRHRNRIELKTVQEDVEEFVKVIAIASPKASHDVLSPPIDRASSISLTIGHINIRLCDRTSPLRVAQLIREVHA
ncbi:IS66 family insertion sequence element accessory protein TnpA [Vibrio mediterranei]